MRNILCNKYVNKIEGSFRGWIDIEKPDEDDYCFLNEKFKINNLDIEECKNNSKRSKFRSYSNYSFIILSSIDKGTSLEVLCYLPVYIFVSREYLITIHNDDAIDFSDIKKLFIESFDGENIDYILYFIIKNVIEDYFNLLEKIESRVENLQEEVMKNTDKSLLNKILDFKRKIIKLRKNIYRKREVALEIINCENPFYCNEHIVYFKEIYERSLMLYDMVESDSEMLSVTLELYSSQLSNKTNDVMKFLTIVTTMMMPITIITGIYGMNFDMMPELHFKYGYLFFWIAIMLTMIIQLNYFRKKKWI